MTDEDPCPCGRGVPYGECCGPLHAGGAAPTAERLMRSRYSAFALGNAEYLMETWDPETRPAELELDAELEWRRLLIRDTSAGGLDDQTGQVAFTAVGRGPDGRFELRERSRFARDTAGRWIYIDGIEA